MTIIGQRKYGGPPPNWEGHPPGNGCEVFCGKIPKEMYEDELIPLFEKCGPIWDLRLMMDPMTGTNRGYAFVTFTNRDSALNAVKEVRLDILLATFKYPELFNPYPTIFLLYKKRTFRNCL